MALFQVDGTLRIFKIVDSNPAPQLLKTLLGPKCDLDGNLQISWKGDLMSVLYGGKMVRIYETDNWTLLSEFNGKTMFSFELLSKDVGLITQLPSEIALYSVAKNEIIESIDYKGLENCSSCVIGYDEKFACVFSDSLLYSIDLHINHADLKIKPQNLLKTKLMGKEFEREKKKQQSKSYKRSKFIDESALSFSSEDEEMNEEIDDISSDEELSRGNASDNDSQDSRLMSEIENETDNDLDTEEIKSKERSQNRLLHPIVNPGCTPWRNLQRYIAYNNIGFITVRRQIENDSIYNYDIEFMDRNSHKPIRFSDEVSYSLGSLDEHGAVLASGGVGSCIHYISFRNSLDSWTISLSLGTEPIRKLLINIIRTN